MEEFLESNRLWISIQLVSENHSVGSCLTDDNSWASSHFKCPFTALLTAGLAASAWELQREGICHLPRLRFTTGRVSLSCDVCLSGTPFSGSDFAFWGEHEYIVNILPLTEGMRVGMLKGSIWWGPQGDVLASKTFPVSQVLGLLCRLLGRLWTGLFYLTFIL